MSTWTTWRGISAEPIGRRDKGNPSVASSTPCCKLRNVELTGYLRGPGPARFRAPCYFRLLAWVVRHLVFNRELCARLDCDSNIASVSPKSLPGDNPCTNLHRASSKPVFGGCD